MSEYDDMTATTNGVPDEQAKYGPMLPADATTYAITGTPFMVTESSEPPVFLTPPTVPKRYCKNCVHRTNGPGKVRDAKQFWQCTVRVAPGGNSYCDTLNPNGECVHYDGCPPPKAKALARVPQSRALVRGAVSYTALGMAITGAMGLWTAIALVSMVLG